VHLGVVGLLDVVKVKHAAAVLVHDAEGLLAEVSSGVVHLASHSSQELLVVDPSTSVSVEDSEESL